ncbi:MAG: hypothetical protein KDB21_09200, partial [Acidimicrobiales bacterium]|nr:hypothetical protein [Acidimicrobiales bacterium]
FLNGTGVGDGPPLIVDQRAAPQLFAVDGDSLVASEADLPGLRLSIDMRDLVQDWSTYESVTRSRGPVSKDMFGG